MPMVKKETEISLLNWHLGVGAQIRGCKMHTNGKMENTCVQFELQGEM